MTSTKITDEMVERAAQAAYEADERDPGDWYKAYHTSKTAWKNFIRAGLEAALTPPLPEIEVSEGMRKAGTKIYMGDDPDEERWDLVTAIYRAMESTRRKEAQDKSFRASLDKAIAEQAQACAAYAAKPTSHHRHTDTTSAPQGEAWSFYQHRRHSDPI